MLPTDRPLTPQEIEQVARDFKRWAKEHRRSFASVSKSLGEGFSPTVLSTFSNSIYKGDAERIARAVNAYMEREGRTADVVKPAGFVTTDVAERILAVVYAAVHARAMGLITGSAGVGKTMTLKAAAQMYPGAIYLRIAQAERRTTGMLTSLATELGVPGRSSVSKIYRLLVEALKGSARPIIIDEAHKCLPDALEALRDLHDEAEVPIILAGTINVKKNVDDYSAHFGQFSSRIVARVDIAEQMVSPRGKGPRQLFSEAEIRRLFEGGQLRLTDDAVDYLVDLANTPGHGHLRLVVRMVELASMAKTVASSGRIDARVLRAILRQMHQQAFAELIEDRRIASGGREIAAAG